MPLKKTVFIIALISLASTAVFSIYYKGKSNEKIISPVGYKPTIAEKVSEAFVPKSELVKLIELRLKDEKGVYGLVIKNLKTGETYVYNEQAEFTAASLYKLWVMAVAYEQINQGNLHETDSVSLSRGKIEELQGFWEEGVSEDAYYSVADAIEQMIVVSDNDSAITLYSNIGVDKIDQFLIASNFTGSGFGSPPKTTPKDIADYFEKLYKGLIVNRNYSDKMLDLLFKQRLNDRIPQLLPKDVRVAHKTGELDTFKHDAGIVELENNDYILVVLTDTPSPENAAGVTAQISKDVYDYFKN